MKTLSDYITDNISESILSSTRTGKAHLDEELKKYGLVPSFATVNADGTIDYNGDVDLCFNNLTNLSKLPFRLRKVSGSFFCYRNNLTTLEGAPEEIKGAFDCSCNSLTNLKGGPEQVGHDYDCSYNKLTSLEGLPKKLKNHLYCYDNPSTFIEEYVLKLCKMDKNKIHAHL